MLASSATHPLLHVHALGSLGWRQYAADFVMSLIQTLRLSQ